MSWQQAALCVAAGAVGAVVALFGAAWAGAYVLAESEARMSDDSTDWLHAEAVHRASRNPGGWGPR